VSKPWVINASPVILLSKAGLIHHVPAVAEPLVIPAPVALEIHQCREVDAAVRWIEGVGKQFIQPPAKELAELAQAVIGPGERAVISWAAANPGFIAVLDDSEARLLARRCGVPVLGTVGVVLDLKAAALIPEIKTYLMEIRRVGGYMSDALFNEALHRAGEHA
jgi:predicted nucleic acid-binding protein